MNRSVSTELDLEAGQYAVRVKIEAVRYEGAPTPEDTIFRNCKTRPKKLQSVARSYDLAHAKGGLKESSLEREKRLRQRRREKRKNKAREDFERKCLLRKKDKLRGLRLKGPVKAVKSDDQPKSDDQNAIAIQINVSGKGLKTTGQPPNAKVEGGMQDNSSHGNSRNFKLTVETSDQAKTVENGATTSPDVQGSEDTSNAGVKAGDGQQKSSTPTGAEKKDEAGKDKTANESKSDEEAPPPSKLALDDISDDGFSWSSDIDAPSDSDSDDSDESDTASDFFEKMSIAEKKDQEEVSEKKPKHGSSQGPWNAVCVFGLRVYTKEAQATIELIRKSDDGKTVKIPSSQDWKAVAGG